MVLHLRRRRHHRHADDRYYDVGAIGRPFYAYVPPFVLIAVVVLVQSVNNINIKLCWLPNLKLTYYFFRLKGQPVNTWHRFSFAEQVIHGALLRWFLTSFLLRY